MNLSQQVGSDEGIVRRYEYDDSWVLVADLGPAAGDLDVDIVGSTAIVVVDTGSEVSEFEIELPSSDASVQTNNGVVTVRGAQ